MKKMLLYPAGTILLLLSTVVANSVFGQTSQSDTKRSEETIDNKVPTRLPIKVEVLYGKGAHTLENVEIKVTNTGKRSIYYLDLLLDTADLPTVYNVSWFTYGRREMRTFKEPANADDPSLRPGEVYVFTLTPKRLGGFRRERAVQQLNTTRYELVFQVLNFGDGTGFMGTGGEPFPLQEVLPSVTTTNPRPSFFFLKSNTSSCSPSPVYSDGLFETFNPVAAGAIFEGHRISTCSCGTKNGTSCDKANPGMATGCCTYGEDNELIPKVDYAPACSTAGYACSLVTKPFFDCGRGDGGGCRGELVEPCTETTPTPSPTPTPQECVDADGRIKCEIADCRTTFGNACDAQCDQDHDGYYSQACGGDDCDDDCITCIPNYANPHETGGLACLNGRDDDCDGPRDCDDPDCGCLPTPEPTPPPVPTPTSEGGGGGEQLDVWAGCNYFYEIHFIYFWDHEGNTWVFGYEVDTFSWDCYYALFQKGEQQ